MRSQMASGDVGVFLFFLCGGFRGGLNRVGHQVTMCFAMTAGLENIMIENENK